MTDFELLSAAITASGRSARRFAMEILGVDERTVRKWLNKRPLPGTVRIVCKAVIDRPAVADELFDANLKLVEAGVAV